MVKKSINFRQERDFGDLFNATFSFISQEFKHLATAILYFVVPFLLLSAIAMTIYSFKAQEMMQTLVQDTKSNPFAFFSIMGSMFGYILVAMVLSLIATSVLLSTVYGYVKLYINKGSNGFTINEVWMQVTKYFWQFLGTTLIVGLVVLAGSVLCLIPGIYLGVALSIVFCIMIFEEKNFSVAFGRSIKLINTNWWLAFGVLIITGIIVYILVIFISIPSMIFGFKSMFTNMKEAQIPEMNFSMGFYIVNSITQLITQLFMVIPIIITAFLYFSTVEKVEKPSLMDKIGQINENE